MSSITHQCQRYHAVPADPIIRCIKNRPCDPSILTEQADKDAWNMYAELLHEDWCVIQVIESVVPERRLIIMGKRKWIRDDCPWHYEPEV